MVKLRNSTEIMADDKKIALIVLNDTVIQLNTGNSYINITAQSKE